MNADISTTTGREETHRPAIVKNAASSYFSAVDLTGGEVIDEVGDGWYWPLDALGTVIEAADVVVTATGASDTVLTAKHATHCAPATSVIDLATPPDVSPEVREHPAVSAAHLDDIVARVRANTRSRRADVTAVENLIDDAIERLIERERENRAEDTIRALHTEAARTRERELERALDRLDEGDCDPETVLSDFASALTSRLLADPTEALRTTARNGDEETIDAARRLFDLDGGESP